MHNSFTRFICVLNMNKDLRNSIAVFTIVLPLFLLLAISMWKFYAELGLAICAAVFSSSIVFFQVYLARDTKKEIRHAHGELEALVNIYSVLEIKKPFPAFGGYVITAGMAKVLLNLFFKHQPKIIVELGSGVSTVILAYAVKRVGQGKIVSFDHEEAFAQKTRDLLQEHGLEKFAEVHHAPLKQQKIASDDWCWYSIPAHVTLDHIDLLIADGPPAQTQRLARYPAFPYFREKLSPQAVVLLDDTHRSEELSIAKRWEKENPQWSLQQDRGARCTILKRKHV